MIYSAINAAVRAPINAMQPDYLLSSGATLSAMSAAIFAKYNGLGVPTIWQDESDMTTLWQESAGSTPVTASGQPIGFIADKSKGLVRGVELWSDAAVTFAGGSSRVSPGVYRIYSADGTYSIASVPSSQQVGKCYDMTFNVDSITTLGAGIANDGGVPSAGFATLGPKRVIYIASGGSAGIKRAGSACNIQISNVSVREFIGYHATQATAGSRSLYTESGGLAYALFDGVDDSWQTTGTVDLSGTDKVTVVAGVRKLSDVATAVIAELGANSNGVTNSFGFFAPFGASASYALQSRGTAAPQSSVMGSSPFGTSNVVSAVADIAAPLVQIRKDGVWGVPNVSTQGTGNFSNAVLNIGRRAGTTLPLNGQKHGFMLIGAIILPAELAVLEAYMASKTGVTL